MVYNYGEPLIKLQIKDVSIAIGNTPVLRLEINGVEFLAKAEWFNMFTIDGTVHGSVKMRPAYYMIKLYIKEHDWREKNDHRSHEWKYWNSSSSPFKGLRFQVCTSNL